MARGMLSDLLNPDSDYEALRREEQDEERAAQFAAGDPFRAMAHTAYTGGTLAGKGAGSAIAGFAGYGARSPREKNIDAVNKAKEQVAALGFNPEDPKSLDAFYKNVIQILQKQGLAAEAMVVAKEWNAEKAAAAKEKLGFDKLALEKEELERKKARDTAIDARSAERNEILKKRFGAAASPMGKLLADMERATNPADRAYFKGMIENLAAHKVIVQDLGDRVQLIDAVTREPIRTDDKGLTPVQQGKDDDATADKQRAHDESIAVLQRQYDAAVELHNMRGVPGITGRLGYWVGEPEKGLVRAFVTLALSSNDARAALAKHEQVQGGTLLSGLERLKNASKTGASGLGALSEVEGNKVQADAAALNRLQEAAAYRAQLAQYVRWLEDTAGRKIAGALQDKVTAQNFQKRPLMVPRGRGAASPAPAVAPAAAPAAPAAERRVRVKAPDGTQGTIPASQLEAAKAAGYTEIQ